MANPRHLKLLLQGFEAWNLWRNSKHQSASPPDLSGADLTRVDFTKTNLSGANLAGVDLRWVDLSSASLYSANLSGASISGANLISGSLCDADLSGSDLTGADLSMADLSSANLTNTNLTRANLRRANLGYARLVRATFFSATLAHADLNSANLRSANLEEANLTNTSLCAATLAHANLRWANLSSADLFKADLTATRIGSTTFADANLDLVSGLESASHEGPSTIGIDTFFRSRGQLPEAFLRGAGVPDALITYAKWLIGSAIEFYSCFISYSSIDQQFAERLFADLQVRGVRCWFAPHAVRSGRKLHEQIDEAIRVYDKLLLILSPHSMSSEWVRTEIAKARKREIRDGARVLFPISLVPFASIRDWECFDADTGKDSAREIREYYIPDFRDWKDHDHYQTAFERLIEDLKSQ